MPGNLKTRRVKRHVQRRHKHSRCWLHDAPLIDFKTQCGCRRNNILPGLLLCLIHFYLFVARPVESYILSLLLLQWNEIADFVGQDQKSITPGFLIWQYIKINYLAKDLLVGLALASRGIFLSRWYMRQGFCTTTTLLLLALLLLLLLLLMLLLLYHQ